MDNTKKPDAVPHSITEESKNAAPPAPPPQNTTPVVPKVAAVEDDDSEDDLDDLDDMLDEFDIEETPNTKKTSAGKDNAVKSGDAAIDDDFALELQAGMADLLGELEGSSELQEQFETLVKELADAALSPTPPSGAAAAAGSSSTPSQPPSSKPAPGASSAQGKAKTTGGAPINFQETIDRTMNRMRESGEEVDATIAESANDDFLTEMLKQMGGAAGMGDNEEDFSKMLLNMMEQLTNKEILYEPMKELAEKYPEWLEKNEASQTREDMVRYREQFAFVRDIVNKFEEPGYKDSNTHDREYIVEKMQKMQAAGSPPAELMGSAAAGEGGTEGLEIPPELEAGCPVQ